jgi:hypothetical protein
MLQSKYATRIISIYKLLICAKRKQSALDIWNAMQASGHKVTLRQIQRDLHAMDGHISADAHKPQGYFISRE